MIPLFKFKIEGSSMHPTFKSGDTVLVSNIPYFLKNPAVEDLVVLKKGRYIIKRIKKIDGDRFFVEGDNKKESADSRNFGWINKKEIIGKVIYKI